MPSGTPDFLYLDDQPVRVTSLTRDGDRISLVVILRGSRAHQQLQETLQRTPLRLTFPGEPERVVALEGAEHVVSGEGERALYRHTVHLGPPSEAEPVPTDELTARLDRIERKLDLLLARTEGSSSG